MKQSQTGFTVLELIAVLGIAGIIMGAALYNLKELNVRAENASSQMMGYIKEIRAKAISTTSAYIISPSSAGELSVVHGTTCSTAATPESRLNYELPSGAFLSDTSWSICFNSRGLPDTDLNIGVYDIDGETRLVEVFYGGAVRVQ